MNEKKCLKSIARIIPGYSFRLGLSKYSSGETKVIQAKDILEDATIDRNALESIDFDSSRSGSRVFNEDVLVSSRGNFRAGFIDFEDNETIIASSVYIVRLISKKILPEYLAIFLNSSAGKRQVEMKITGASISVILRKDLGEVKVAIPSIDEQRKIIELHHINKKLQEALDRKKKLIAEINEIAINKIIGK